MRILTVPEPGTNTVIQDGTQGCLTTTWAYAPPHLGIDPTEEVLVTFSGALADRHPPTAPGESEPGVDVVGKAGVRLLIWGDPYLRAWLEAVRGAPRQAAAILCRLEGEHYTLRPMTLHKGRRTRL